MNNVEDVKVLDQECGVTDLKTSIRVEIAMWVMVHVKEPEYKRIYELAGRIINEDDACTPTCFSSSALSKTRETNIKYKYRDLYSVLKRTPLINNKELVPLIELSGV